MKTGLKPRWVARQTIGLLAAALRCVAATGGAPPVRANGPRPFAASDIRSAAVEIAATESDDFRSDCDSHAYAVAIQSADGGWEVGFPAG